MKGPALQTAIRSRVNAMTPEDRRNDDGRLLEAAANELRRVQEIGRVATAMLERIIGDNAPIEKTIEALRTLQDEIDHIQYP